MQTSQTAANLHEQTAARPYDSFSQVLTKHGISLTRRQTNTLQVNVGLLCNQSCSHCHLDAGPARREIMDRDTAAQVVDLAGRLRFATIDITGGAPEMNPHIAFLIENLTPLTGNLILRSNLTAIADSSRSHLLELCRKNRVTIIASFPSLNEAQTEAQRGRGVFSQSLATLNLLNSLGYGRPNSGLALHLVTNPAGAFMAIPQEQVEKRFRDVLRAKWNLEFNSVFSFANVPLGRFRSWLESKGNLESYLDKLAAAFNPCATDRLMCRTHLSVSWDGCLFDCDFNQAIRLHLGGRKTHISELQALPEPGAEIAVADHCFTCTAGTGFT